MEITNEEAYRTILRSIYDSECEDTRSKTPGAEVPTFDSWIKTKFEEAIMPKKRDCRCSH